MTCLTQCFGATWWIPLLVIAGWYIFAAVVDAIPETFAIGVVPVGRILHALAGNVFRALRKAPGGEQLPVPPPP